MKVIQMEPVHRFGLDEDVKNCCCSVVLAATQGVLYEADSSDNASI
jgi:hypothetical protein